MALAIVGWDSPTISPSWRCVLLRIDQLGQIGDKRNDEQDQEDEREGEQHPHRAQMLGVVVPAEGLIELRIVGARRQKAMVRVGGHRPSGVGSGSAGGRAAGAVARLPSIR